MSVFGSIMGKIFGHPAGEHPAAGSAAEWAQAAPTPPGPASAAQPQPAAPQPTSSAAPPTAAPQPAAAPQQSVDVAAVLTDMASRSPQKLDWRHSIVDLMKLLGLDSSLDERKKLAQELGYSGDTNDSASMNIWLHKQVMQKLAENGGKVPDDLKS
jgi:3-oxoacyl-ACP reductase-like protein